MEKIRKIIKKKKAFTLIELLVTIAVLGILVLLASPRFFGHVQNAELTKGFANAKSIEKASELYYMDYEDWPRLTDDPYTSEEIESYSERIFDRTGHEVNLDPEGNYYDIDYDKLSDYIQVPDDKKNYILQNPVGKIYYLDNLNEAGRNRADYTSNKLVPVNFAFSGSEKSFTVTATGVYKIEVWGAEGGTSGYGGKGGYAEGLVSLAKGEILQVSVGGLTGYNGGGSGHSRAEESGGGATDVRRNGSYLTDRIIVAGGGGGYGGRHTITGGSGGGTTGGIGGTGYGTPGYGGSQLSGGSGGSSNGRNGSLGQGGSNTTGSNSSGGGGGGGYYGGGAGGNDYPRYNDRDDSGGGGGSSYIGGVQNGSMIAGNQSMPNPNGGNMVGNSGHGFARITRVD